MNWNVGLDNLISQGCIDMNRLELLYAKWVFRSNTEKRMAICRKLASLLRNDFTLIDALERLEMVESKNGTKPNEPFAIVMRQWQKNLEKYLLNRESIVSLIQLIDSRHPVVERVIKSEYVPNDIIMDKKKLYILTYDHGGYVFGGFLRAEHTLP